MTMVVKKEEEGGGEKRALVWFRKGLRLHDNPALVEASKSATALYPVFILDPAWLKPEEIGANRTQVLHARKECIPFSFTLFNVRSFGSSYRIDINSSLYVHAPQFLLDSLVDLDNSLQKLGSSLLCFRGKPEEILPSLMKVSDAAKVLSFSFLFFFFFCFFVCREHHTTS